MLHRGAYSNGARQGCTHLRHTFRVCVDQQNETRIIAHESTRLPAQRGSFPRDQGS